MRIRTIRRWTWWYWERRSRRRWKNRRTRSQWLNWIGGFLTSSQGCHLVLSAGCTGHSCMRTEASWHVAFSFHFTPQEERSYSPRGDVDLHLLKSIFASNSIGE